MVMRVHRFTPPLLDRLFDDAVGLGADPLLRGLTLEQMKACVARDIESLLNARIGPRGDVLSDYPLARASIISFGLDDFVGLSLANPKDRERICAAIRDAINRHEPRLTKVVVSIAPNASAQQFLNFSVTAMLVLAPAVEAVSFDALLQPSTQQYAVTALRQASGGFNAHG